MNRVFIIDTENTNDLKFLKYFSVNYSDSIYFLFNENSQRLSWSYTRDLFYVNCNVEFVELKATGLPNGLDFQISNFLGTLLEKLNGVVYSFYIVTRDKGFLANKGIINELYKEVVFEVIDPETCKFLGYDIPREHKEYVEYKEGVEYNENVEYNGCINYKSTLNHTDLELIPITTPNLGFNLPSKVKCEMENVIRDYLKEYFCESEIDKCIEMFFKSNSLNDLHNKLITSTSRESGEELYRCVKGLFGKSIEEMRHHVTSNSIIRFIGEDRFLSNNDLTSLSNKPNKLPRITKLRTLVNQ